MPEDTAEQLVDNEVPPQSETLDGAVQSVAEAYDDPEQHQNEEEEQTSVASIPVAHDVPEDIPEAPVVHYVPQGNNKKTPIQLDEDEDEDDDDVVVPVRASNRGTPGAIYFPVSFGSTNGGAIAIANSYSTGKGNSCEKIYFNRMFYSNLLFYALPQRGGSGRQSHDCCRATVFKLFFPASSRATAYGSPAKTKRRNAVQ